MRYERERENNTRPARGTISCPASSLTRSLPNLCQRLLLHFRGQQRLRLFWACAVSRKSNPADGPAPMVAHCHQGPNVSVELMRPTHSSLILHELRDRHHRMLADLATRPTPSQRFHVPSLIHRMRPGGRFPAGTTLTPYSAGSGSRAKKRWMTGRPESNRKATAPSTRVLM